MPRRPGNPLYGSRFCGNMNKMEVHDLDNEKISCQINEIIAAGHSRTFNPDTLAQARIEGYDNCAYCIGSSTR
jgi:hypothetical protein